MKRIYELSDKEVQDVEAFCEKHQHKRLTKDGIGGHITLTFTPTSVGTGAKVTCGICGKSKDITDYDNW